MPELQKPASELPDLHPEPDGAPKVKIPLFLYICIKAIKMPGRTSKGKLVDIRDYPAIGRVEYHASLRTSSVRISVAPFRPVKVTIPLGFSLEKAESILRQRLDWIQKHQEKHSHTEARRTLFLPGNEFKTRFHSLVFQQTDRPGLRAELRTGIIRILASPDIALEAEGPQAFIRKVIGRALCREGMVYLPQRTIELAGQHGLKVKEIKVKDMKSRWGSCAPDHRITLNAHLMRLPDTLIDLIILHELAHTVHANHGPHFHALLGRICPRNRELDRQLKGYSPTIF